MDTLQHLQIEKKNEKFSPSRRQESNPRPKFYQAFPTPQNQKNEERNFFSSTIPTPGIEPTTKHFKADAKMT